MKGKLLSGLVLVSVAASSGFGMEFHHGKLLSHKEWTTGDVRVTFKEVKKPSVRKLLKFTTRKQTFDENHGERILSESRMLTADGVVGEELSVYGSSAILISNETSTSQTYKVTTYMCVQDEPCGSSEDTFILDAWGTVEAERVPEMIITPTQSGHSETFILTHIETADDRKSPDFESISFGHMNVADARPQK